MTTRHSETVANDGNPTLLENGTYAIGEVRENVRRLASSDGADRPSVDQLFACDGVAARSNECSRMGT